MHIYENLYIFNNVTCNLLFRKQVQKQLLKNQELNLALKKNKHFILEARSALIY